MCLLPVYSYVSTPAGRDGLLETIAYAEMRVTMTSQNLVLIWEALLNVSCS